jgi:hypothetical protein
MSAKPVEARNHLFAVIAGTILVLGLARAVLVVVHSPVLGYTHGTSEFPPQLVGAAMLAIVAAVAIFTAWCLRRNPVASIVHALIFFLIVGDPVAALWLNAARPETSALVGLYTAVAMIGVVGLGTAGRVQWALLMVSLLLIAAGPHALVGLPLLLVIATWRLLVSRFGRDALWLAAFCIVLIAIGHFVVPHVHSPIPPASGETTVIAAPAADDGRLAEPLRTVRELARVIPVSASLAPAGLDTSAAPGLQSVVDLPPYIMTFTGLLPRIPVVAWMMIAMTVILTAPLASLALSWSLRRPDVSTPAIPAAYAALAAIGAYAAIAAAVGAEDASRILSLGWLAILAAVLMLPVLAWHLARDLWTGPVALVCAIGVLLLAGGWLAWSREQPIAVGAIERVTAGPGRTLEVSGWAIDPRGVRRVFATVGGGPETTAALGGERRDLQAAYPGYPDSVTGAFQMSIAPNAWRENQPLRVYAENRTGAITEIDRRDVRPSP